MCGIFGIYKKNDSIENFDPQPVIDNLRHRGPDYSNFKLINKNLIFVHTRLKIIDLSENANQPMTDLNERFTITYNGEIYNYLSIKEQLIKLGYKFKSKSDTEVFLYGFIEWKEKLFEKLNGIFAVAIFDNKTKVLIIARDHLGVKPLYYYYERNTFIFSSEIKALLLNKIFERKVNIEDFPEHLMFKYISGSSTIYKNIQQLLPGSFLKIEGNSTTPKFNKYWDLKDNLKKLNKVSMIEYLDDKLNTICKNQLMSDVPVGYQLSGGIDSSLLSSYIAKRRKNFNTYTIGFKNYKWDERNYASKVARLHKTIHHEILMNDESFFRNFEKVIWHYDLPLNHPHSIAIYKLAKLAGKSVRVLLSGEGADEILYGYERYLKLGEDSTDMDIVSNPLFLRPGEEKLMFKNIKLDIIKNPFENRLEILKMAPKRDWLSKLKYLEINSHLLDLLNRQDKMLMASSIEGRVPFLDIDLVNYCFQIRPESNLNKVQTKPQLKKMLSKYFDKKFVYRPKIGFRVPFNEWIVLKKWNDYLSIVLDPSIKEIFGNKFCDTIYGNIINKKNIDLNAKYVWLMINLFFWKKIFKVSF